MPSALMMEAATCYLPNKSHGVTSQNFEILILPQCSKKDRLKYCSLTPKKTWIDNRRAERVGIDLKHEKFIRKVSGSNLGRGMIVVTQASQRACGQTDVLTSLVNKANLVHNFS